MVIWLQPVINISNGCSPLIGQAGLSCAVQLPPGCYRLQLQQSAPWFDNAYYAEHCRLMHHSFCTYSSVVGREGDRRPALTGFCSAGWEEWAVPAREANVPRWAWLGGGALLAALGAALLLLLARRSPLSRKLREEAAKALQKRLDTCVPLILHSIPA